MVSDALMDRILAGSHREKEIEVETQSEYDQWVSELYSEIEVFVKRVNSLDLSKSDDRSNFYDFAGRLSDRLLELRDRSEASSAPAEALIKLEDMIEQINNTASKVHVSVAYIGDDPFEKARREEKRKQSKKERIKRAEEKREEIAKSIEEFIAALDGDGV